MKGPVSILPSRPAAPVSPGPVASPSAPTAPSDETLLDGLVRRGREMAADMRSGDSVLMLLLALPWSVALLLTLELRPFDWSINVNAVEWRWLTESSIAGGLGWGGIVAVKIVALALLPLLVGLAGFAVYRWRLNGLMMILLAGGLVYSYGPGLANARGHWSTPQYSHGWLVPVCSLALLLWWRQPSQPATRSAQLAGLGLLAASFLLRLVCARFRIITVDMYTFVPALAGVFLLVGGWHSFRWAWVPIAILIFMFPLPDEATRYLLLPLQYGATKSSTFALQTLGFDAYREGNTIRIGESDPLGVVDQCSGLRMLTIFIWLAIMIAIVMDGEWWESVAIMILSVPIALLVNTIRITATGMVHAYDADLAKMVHDWAGLFMMPLALGFLFAIHKFLASLVIDEVLAPSMVVQVRSPRLGPAPLSVGRSPTEARSRRPEGPATGI